MPLVTSTYRAPRWLPGGHLQTIWPARLVPLPHVAYRRERWPTPDGDFIDVDFAQPEPAAPDAPLIAISTGTNNVFPTALDGTTAGVAAALVATGSIDIADAIYVLAYLFNQGPSPVPIEGGDCDSCCPPCPAAGLPATGQATCYGGEEPWAEIDCASAEYPGQDGFYQAGCASAERFADNGDGTVTDNCTGLVWQKETAPGTYTWPQALRYSEGLELAGHDDWRLPNVRELQSIVDYGRYNPSIDPIFGAVSYSYWSSSTLEGYPDYAWYVYFDDGLVSSASKYSAFYVRAVRSGP